MEIYLKNISKGRKEISLIVQADTVSRYTPPTKISTWIIRLTDLITDEVKSFVFDAEAEAVTFMSELYDTL